MKTACVLHGGNVAQSAGRLDVAGLQTAFFPGSLHNRNRTDAAQVHPHQHVLLTELRRKKQ